MHEQKHPEIWLIRHGETEWSKSGQHTSRTDLALTTEGEKRAVTLGAALKGHPFGLVLASPMRRAQDTARLAGYSPVIEDNLREWDYGKYEGLTSHDIHKEVPGWTIWNGAVPGGETGDQVAARADRVIERAVAVGQRCRALRAWTHSARGGGAMARHDGGGGQVFRSWARRR